MDISYIEKQVKALLGAEGSGHDWEHIRRVTATAGQLAAQEKANAELVTAAALLHDIDDQKLTNDSNSEYDLHETRRILQEANASDQEIDAIVTILQSTGFRKSLVGVTPDILEARILSDADYLDAIGAVGIARCFTFGGSRGRPLFTPDAFPKTEYTQAEYLSRSGHSANHFFDKLLKLKDKMYTDAGRTEAQKRHLFMKQYLEQLFHETAAPKQWFDLLNQH